MKNNIKTIIKERIKTNELNLRLFNIVRNHVKKFEGQKYTRRYLVDITADIANTFGNNIFKYSGATLDTSLTWKSIKLDLDINNGYSYSYQLYYDSQEYFTLEEFDRLNQCWSLDAERNKKLHNLLKDNDVLSKMSKSITAINKANETLEELFEYGTDASEIQYSVKDLLNVKLERK